MNIEKINCPSCGKLIDISLPISREVVQIRTKSFFNILQPWLGIRMYTVCQNCHKKITIWTQKKNPKVYQMLQEKQEDAS
ncbi:MAG: hypothetical protein HeimC3_17140 [Candidatus Heimdallarchaeota archaeon LC_3]|nr:MAG: hypothetical protein HeimC3_30210 [Candidatus Heimdallarchaeota archaeon LC_3]OLS24839.1 MAG: hypothetical protein HeimC3_17140 [Candidatus Heimdallarchaeota archaeon LC_3]